MSEQEHYVACLDLTGRRVVVIGDGEEKAKALRGKLAIAVRPTVATDCTNGRWKTWGGWSSEPQCLASF